MAKKSYSELLKDPRWQKKRLEVLERCEFTCQICGDTETTLHVHHYNYKGKPWEADDVDLTVYCEHCHSITHKYDSLNNLEKLLLSETILHRPYLKIDYSQFEKNELIKILKIYDFNKLILKKKVFNLI